MLTRLYFIIKTLFYHENKSHTAQNTRILQNGCSKSIRETCEKDAKLVGCL